jgi:hypothetical protein
MAIDEARHDQMRPVIRDLDVRWSLRGDFAHRSPDRL